MRPLALRAPCGDPANVPEPDQGLVLVAASGHSPVMPGSGGGLLGLSLARVERCTFSRLLNALLCGLKPSLYSYRAQLEQHYAINIIYPPHSMLTTTRGYTPFSTA